MYKRPLQKRFDAPAFMVLLRSGKTAPQIVQAKIVTKAGYRRYRLAHPKWAAAVDKIDVVNRARAQRTKGFLPGIARKKAQTHCSRGHMFTKETTRVRNRGNAICRECKICERDRQTTRGPLMSEDQKAKVMEALKRRVPFSQFAHGFPTGQHWKERKRSGQLSLVDANKFYRERRADPAFDEAVRKSIEGHEKRAGERIRRKSGEKTFRWVRSLMPVYLSDDAKAEVTSMILEAVLLKRYRKAVFRKMDVEGSVKRFITDYNKMHPTRAFGGVQTPWSLDDVVPGTDGLRRIDTITEGMWK